MRPHYRLAGTDVDENVLKSARLNAENAGVAKDIHFQQKAFSDLRSKRRYGCIITNPPYGQRLDERRNLLSLYQSFPSVLQRLPTWSFYILTDLPDFEGMVQKSATRRRKLFNGRIECMYYQYMGPKPTSFATRTTPIAEQPQPRLLHHHGLPLRARKRMPPTQRHPFLAGCRLAIVNRPICSPLD